MPGTQAARAVEGSATPYTTPIRGHWVSSSTLPLGAPHAQCSLLPCSLLAALYGGDLQQTKDACISYVTNISGPLFWAYGL